MYFGLNDYSKKPPFLRSCFYGSPLLDSFSENLCFSTKRSAPILWAAPRETQPKSHTVKRGFYVAPRLGFEPRYTAPEAVVLPLDDLGIGSNCGQIISNVGVLVKRYVS